MKTKWLFLIFVAFLSVVFVPALAWAQQGTPEAQPTPAPPPPLLPGQVILSPLGIGLAVVFLILMVNLFRWMFRVPPQVPYEVVKARQSVSALRRLLVPTTEDRASERVVELACRLGQAQRAEIVLAYVVEVPWTLSLNEHMPAEEAKGQEALRTSQFIVEQHGLPVKTQLLPSRYAWAGILHLAKDEMVDAIIMGVGSRRPAEGVSRTVQEVLKGAPCEVILDRPPERSVPA